MNVEIGILSTVINNLVFDLYFAEEMKAKQCYITDRVSEVLKPFKEDDSDDFKREYIDKFTIFCHHDRNVYRGLLHSGDVKMVAIICGDK